MNEDVTNHVVRRHRPILGILGVRRSTKIEPQQNNTSSDDEHAHLDEQTLLTNHLLDKKKVLERNNTFPRLNDNLVPKDECNELDLPSNNNNSTNRYSICCSQLTTTNGIMSSDPRIEGGSNDEAPSSARPLAVKPSYAQYYNLPSSYPSPILLSCRSRFRDKFFPPSSDQHSLLLKDHNSTPNIPTSSPLSRLESRRSGSYEAIAIEKPNDVSGDTSGKITTDSLATHALMAAHVFHLIPTEKARQRNFLQGRSASNSLLGTVELEKACPNRDVTIFVGSWNMNGQSNPKQMSDFILPNAIEHLPDLAVIGTQESCSDKFEWEVTLQETLG